MAYSFCAVPDANLIYAGPRTKEEFDRIGLPETVHEWAPDKVETALRADGLRYERRCHSKVLGDIGSVTVIFQWFDSRVAATATMENPHVQDPVLPQLERGSEPGRARGLEADAATSASVGGPGTARRMVVGGAR